MKSEFLISSISTGKLNAMVKNIMKRSDIADPEEVVRMVNTGEIQIIFQPKWVEKNGIIYFSVFSDGTTGKEWIFRLENKGFRVKNCVKTILCSEDFEPTNDIIYEVAVLRSEIFSENECLTKNIRERAEQLNFSSSNLELACLTREKFTNEELQKIGLNWIVVMNEPIRDLLFSIQSSSISANHSASNTKWSDSGGFIFTNGIFMRR